MQLKISSPAHRESAQKSFQDFEPSADSVTTSDKLRMLQMNHQNLRSEPPFVETTSQDSRNYGSPGRNGGPSRFPEQVPSQQMYKSTKAIKMQNNNADRWKEQFENFQKQGNATNSH